MRTITAILIGCLIYTEACTDAEKKAAEKPVPKLSLREWISQTNRKETSHTLVFAVSQADCINCKIAFTEVFRRLVLHADSAERIVVIFPNTRMVERQTAVDALFGNISSGSCEILYDNALFADAIAQLKTGKGISALLIYNKKADLEFAAFGKTITGTEPELLPFLQR
ncbi:MAG: hypothetical protein ACK5Z2_19515 [Bacteroidota bacterium]|jgi:hypothetical protein